MEPHQPTTAQGTKYDTVQKLKPRPLKALQGFLPTYPILVALYVLRHTNGKVQYMSRAVSVPARTLAVNKKNTEMDAL